MKKVIFILVCVFHINSINCFSQSIEKNKKEFESKTKYVYGYSNDFNEAISMGISFVKVLSSIKATYYIKFHFNESTSEYRTDICLNKASAITFLSESGRFVDLKLNDVRSILKSDKRSDDPFTPIKVFRYSTILILEVTREELIRIGSEPFYKIILPYFDCSSKVNNKVVFGTPALFTRRIFIQKNINYILDI